MKRLFMAVTAVALAAVLARAQQNDKPAQAPETTMNGAKAVDAKKADKSVKKEKKGKAVVEDYTPQAPEYGKKAKCPVSGEEFKVGPDTKAVKYKGKTYYFCCGGCMPKFKKQPAKFAK
jgi:YHS domain-containing protein